MAKRNQHVVPLGSGWAVKDSGAAEATVITSRQSEAIDYATRLAKKEKTEVIIHDRNGKIRERNSYSTSPISSNGE